MFLMWSKESVPLCSVMEDGNCKCMLSWKRVKQSIPFGQIFVFW